SPRALAAAAEGPVSRAAKGRRAVFAAIDDGRPGAPAHLPTVPLAPGVPAAAAVVPPTSAATGGAVPAVAADQPVLLPAAPARPAPPATRRQAGVVSSIERPG